MDTTTAVEECLELPGAGAMAALRLRHGDGELWDSQTATNTEQGRFVGERPGGAGCRL